MENGHDGILADRLSGLALKSNSNNDSSNISSNNNDSLFQVMKAVEAAEATIKQQVEENDRLRIELQKKIEELEKYESMTQRPQGDTWKESVQNSSDVQQSAPSLNGLEDRTKRLSSNSALDPSGTLVIHQNLKPNVVGASTQSHLGSHPGSSSNNGELNMLPSEQLQTDNSGPSRFSSPSTTSVAPIRYPLDGEYDQRFNLSAQGLMPMAEVNNPNSLWKQDLVLKIREHEEEIRQLRKHLSEYSIKEAQIRNEKYVLEKRIAHMRMAFDQQQQDLVDAASKALSYRQDIIEENIHLTYQLQAAQQERTTFIQSLLPLLSEYSLQPPVPDAQSIVSNVKVLFKHLQEKLILTESKLKESQYQLTPWRSDLNQSTYSPQSPPHSSSAAVVTTNHNGLELVPRQAYSHGRVPTASDAQAASDWDMFGDNQSGLSGGTRGNLDDDMRRFSPFASRNPASQDISAQLASSHEDMNATRYGEETAHKQVKFRVPVSNSEMDDPDADEHQSVRGQFNSGNSPYTSTHDDPNPSYSYLTPVHEEPEPSSFSEAADDDPLPAIEGLQISGEAFPGQQLQACGYSINGTTSCNFEWVRHREDGSVNYIDGAKQPNYLVTADDVESYLAIEVQPLDDRKRKGELVKVFANENRKITCDPEMQQHIEKTLYSGHASYKVSLPTGYLGIWEPATLAIKREGYSIKCTGPSGVVVAEKFSPTITVSIPFGNAAEFLIIGPNGDEHLLRADDSSADVSCSRDTIVLTLRLFIRRANEKKKGKKRGLFFNK